MEPRVIQALAYLEDTIHLHLDGNYERLCSFAIMNYGHSYGGSAHHHAYPGGLAVHVSEVLHHCMAMSDFGDVDCEVLITAVIWHDYCKIHEYRQEGDKVVKTEYASQIGHLVGSVLEFSFHAGGSLPKKDAIIHCMLSHHGRKEWGSPVEPATREAWILHSADMLSSRGR